MQKLFFTLLTASALLAFAGCYDTPSESGTATQKSGDAKATATAPAQKCGDARKAPAAAKCGAGKCGDGK